VIPKECKRLAEVDFPVAVVSMHATHEKNNVRSGHPKSLHQWWARRPLAACRAMLLGLLFPDPCDPYCPEDFKRKAKELLLKVQGRVGPKDEDLQQALLKFIGDFSNWDVSKNQTYLEVSRGLVKAAYSGETPLVVDPFAGAGSIPVEALRIGCEVFASDLNPVACLILKVLLGDIPQQGSDLIEGLRKIGARIKEETEKDLINFYPSDLDGNRPISYLWARTIRCEDPHCGAEIPLVRSFWLCKKANMKRALLYQINRLNNGRTRIEFQIYEPVSEKDVSPGTVTLAKARCLTCGRVLLPERVRDQLRAQRGGGDVIFNSTGRRIGGARLMAVLTLKHNSRQHCYRLPTLQDYEAVYKAKQVLDSKVLDPLPSGLSVVPDEPLPSPSGFKYSEDGLYYNFTPVVLYGIQNWGDLFSCRQKLALILLAEKIRKLEVSESLKELLAIVLSELTERFSTLAWLDLTWGKPMGTFSRQALPMVWDFLEVLPVFEEGHFAKILKTIISIIKTFSNCLYKRGQVQIADACDSPLPDASCSVWFTDPPYYDAIPYAYLSDFFFVWLKRTLWGNPLLLDPFDTHNKLTPKRQEIIDTLALLRGVPKNQAKSRNIPIKDRVFFEEKMTKAFAEGRRILDDKGVGCVIFAHKTTEGWEALLSGMIKGGWAITGSWPIATEMGSRLRARDSAALATSVHLVCRPRPENAPVGDWGEVLRELPKRVGDWMERLQSEGIRGADLVFACIGPALEIYSRYSKVVDAEEREIPLGGDPEATEPHRKGFLAYVWEVVGRTALEHVLGTPEARARNSTAGALEEDARLTALFLWTLQSTNGNGAKAAEEEPDEDQETDEEQESPKKKKQGYSLIFDVVRRFAQPLGIHLPEWEGRVIETEKGVVRLLSVKDRAKQLFGEESAQAFADRFERSPEVSLQLKLFPEGERGAAPEIKGHKGRKKKVVGTVSDEALRARQEATTLDRVHAAMLLQSSGRTNALRALLKAEQDRGPDFLRLANALSALYPKQSEEKRLLDAMLLAIPR